MASAQQIQVADGFTELSRGVHSGAAKIRLSNSHAAFAVNATFRDDLPCPRPGWQQITLTHADGDTQEAFEEALFQGASIFTPLDGNTQIVASIGGRLFAIDPLTPAVPVTEVTVAGDVNDPTQTQAWFCQVPGWLVVQDNQSRAIIYDGNTSRRSNTAQREVPVGNVMAYGQGRLWVTLPDRRSFVAGDIIYGDSGTAPFQSRDSVLRFTENEIVNGGGAFGVPLEAGPITAMRFVGLTDTSTGQGPLQVFTEGSTFTVNAPVDREQWANTTSPLQTVSLPDGGATGPYAVTSVNSDLWYRDDVGVRSFIIAQRDTRSWANMPLSRPVDRVLTADDPHLLQYASAVSFDNRLLMTCCPQRFFGRGIYHLGLVALDFAPISDTDEIQLETARPRWEGLWTGLRILQLVVGKFNKVKRCFAFVLGDDDKIELWELLPDAIDDDAGASPIQWMVELPEYTFNNSRSVLPFQLKRLKGGELFLDKMRGEDLNVEILYAPDNYPLWTSAAEWGMCSPVATCDLDCAGTPARAQVRSHLLFNIPQSSCRVGQDMLMDRGYTFSFLLKLTGHFTLKRLRVGAILEPERQIEGCTSSEDACATLRGCDEYLFAYAI